MAQEASGLGWYANGGSICRNTYAFTTLGGYRSFSKLTNTPAVVANICNDAGNFWYPVVISSDSAAVGVYISRADDRKYYNHEYTIEGHVWYFNDAIGGYGWSGGPEVVDSAYPILPTAFNLSTIEGAIALMAALGITYTKLESYTIHFNANGGTGTMTDQGMYRNHPEALHTNTFTKTDYTFEGWATSSGGPVVYTDGEIVDNLAEDEGEITLYAVWSPSPMSILIQRNNSENNKVGKNITTLSTLSGRLRAETSIINPVILVGVDISELTGANYMTIPKFERSYFINDLRSIRTGLTEITAHVDVLESFQTEIKASTAIIRRQENDWNLYLNDGTFRTRQNPDVVTQPFPTGFNGWSFVLAVAGTASAS